MNLNEKIDISAQWINECCKLIDGAQIQGNSDRERISGALLHLALEHHEAIQILVSCDQPSPPYGSAGALLRPQFEAYIRAVWLRRCAKDSEIKTLIEKDKLPKYDKVQSELDGIIKRIEELPAFEEKKLSSTKKDVWKNMCSLTHGGMVQMSNRVRGAEIANNYTPEQVFEILRNACVISLQVMVEYADLLKNNEMANDILSTYYRLFPKQPDV